MATEPLADGFEEMLWIDSGSSFEPAAVDRLRSHPLPIVCGIYARKGGALGRPMFVLDPLCLGLTSPHSVSTEALPDDVGMEGWKPTVKRVVRSGDHTTTLCIRARLCGYKTS